MNHRARSAVVAVAFVIAFPSAISAQLRKLRVVSPDSAPIAYAFVSLEGGTGQITDESGEISLGTGKAQTLTANVRRIGFQPWFGKVQVPDTTATITVVLPRIAQKLTEVRVTGSESPLSLPMRGFYDRWLMRQKGLLSAVFIGPEEIEFRHPNKITNMLNGLSGVRLVRSVHGFAEAYGAAGSCKMAILIDGVQQCPPIGCKNDTRPPCGPSGRNQRGAPCDPDEDKVLIDDILDASTVAAIEVYPRGGNTPISLQVNDSRCGVIALWTGSKR
jgi:hypothetical protein